MCVNFLTKFVHIGIKHSIIMVQVLENTYHNDTNKKKKKTLSNCMSEGNMHVHMLPHLHVLMSKHMSEI